MRPGPRCSAIAGTARSRPYRLAVGALVAGGLLGACSSASPHASNGTTTSAASSTTAAPSSHDAALAASELLAASAYPTGWRGQGAASKNSGASFFGGTTSSDLSQIVSCLGISQTDVDTNPTEDAAQEYADPNSDVTVTDTVDVFPEAAEAVKDVEAAANPKTPTCLVQLEGSKISEGLPAGATAGMVMSSDGSIPKYGDHDAAVVIDFSFTYQGVSGTEYLEFVVVQKGRSESNLVFSNTGGVAPSSTVDRLAQEAADQLTT